MFDRCQRLVWWSGRVEIGCRAGEGGAMNRLIATGAAAYAGLGVVSFLRPQVVPAVVGGTAPTADARTEVRAVYGGLPLAFAATLAAAPAAGVPIGLATLGMAAARTGSAAFEGRPSAKTAGFIALELLIGAALVLGARRDADPARRAR
jgi:hypothetical protein